MPDLRELRVFVAVAEHLSFTRAAEQLHFTQQSVSRTIRDLERELEVDLFERTSREVRLTQAGEALLLPAKDMLAQAAAAFELTRSVGSGRAGQLRAGVTPAIGPDTRAEIVGALRTDSGRAVSLLDVRPGDLAPRMRDRTVDLAFASASGTTSELLDRAELRPFRMQVHVPADHPLSASETAHLQDFDGARLLVASSPGSPFTDLLVKRFAEAGASVQTVTGSVTGGAELLTELVEAKAIAAMPSGTRSPAGARRLEVPGFTMPLLVLWAAGRPHPAVRQIRDDLG